MVSLSEFLQLALHDRLGALSYDVLRGLCCAQLIVGVHRMFYCDSSDFSSNDNGDQTMAARQRAALEAVFNYYKARPFAGCDLYRSAVGKGSTGMQCMMQPVSCDLPEQVARAKF